MIKVFKALRLLFTQGPKAVYYKIKGKQTELKRLKQANHRLEELHLISEEERKKQKERVFLREEKFSILTPLYNTPAAYLHEMIQSLQKQTDGNWELCLANGSDEQHSEVDEICRQYVAKDARIKYQLLKENEGISGNTNACLELATGSYIGLLDHDDILHESALYEMMCAIEETKADFLYTDEVKFPKDITRIPSIMHFNFKSDFGKDELRAHNYICHFTVFSRALLEREGGRYRAAFDGSQDHDMVLRLTEIADCIVHIPRVLYYWRVHEESVTMNLAGKSYAVEAGIGAVREQLKRMNEPGVVVSNLPYHTIYRIEYELRERPLISVILYGIKEPKKLEKALKKWQAQTSYESVEWIVAEADVTSEEGVSKLNHMAQEATGKHLIFLHCKVRPLTMDWVEQLLMYAQREDVACVGGKVRYLSNHICFGGIALAKESPSRVRCLCRGMYADYPGFEIMLYHVRNTTAVWLGCLMINKEKFLKIGGYRAKLRCLADIDLGLRARKEGWWNVWTPFAEAEYRGPVEVIDYGVGNVQLFDELWQDELAKPDPFCHPQLKEKNLV